MELICAEARTRYPAQVANLIETWFWSGMRTSEIFGLQWPNIDLNKGEVLVREALVRGERKDATKTNVARLVKLNSRSRVAVQQQRPHTQMAGGPVFHDPGMARRGTTNARSGAVTGHPCSRRWASGTAGHITCGTRTRR
jgi:integrase